MKITHAVFWYINGMMQIKIIQKLRPARLTT